MNSNVFVLNIVYLDCLDMKPVGNDGCSLVREGETVSVGVHSTLGVTLGVFSLLTWCSSFA